MQQLNEPQTDTDKVLLENEREALKSFLASDGYKAGKAVNEEIVADGLDLLVNLEVKDISDVCKIFEARGEVRALQSFEKRYRDRIAEITELLGDAKEEKSS